jgi:hypothetical protein
VKKAALLALGLTLCSMLLLAGLPSLPVHADESADSSTAANGLVADSAQDASEAPRAAITAEKAQDLTTIINNIAPVSQETRLRRNVAQASFCLPQNVLGILYYGLLQLTGSVVGTADMNEVKIIVTRTPFGVSLGRYIFISTALQTENTVRHEYGHTMQGYKHGPFYLPFEGLVSFAQATISLISPSFARRYFDRWPENEANALGAATSAVSLSSHRPVPLQPSILDESPQAVP